MPSGTYGVKKAERILRLYHIFLFCQEVSFKEMHDCGVPGSKKTILRDIAILKKVGVDIRYSAKRKAYVVNWDGCEERVFTENTAEARFLNKISRLISISGEIMPGIDCDKWYMENVPGATRRTMQRDFALLRKVGYEIWYQREMYDWYVHEDKPLRHYYCVPPNSLNDLWDKTDGPVVYGIWDVIV